MKLVKNTGIQGIQIFIKTPKGGEWQYLTPKSTLVISDQQISEQMRTLSKRRKLQISQYKG